MISKRVRRCLPTTRSSSGISCGWCWPRSVPHWHLRSEPQFPLPSAEQQPEQLSACITCSACYRNPYSHPHEYATDDNFMHNEFQSRAIALRHAL